MRFRRSFVRSKYNQPRIERYWFVDDLANGQATKLFQSDDASSTYVPQNVVVFVPGRNVTGTVGGLELPVLDQWKILQCQGELMFWFDAENDDTPGSDTKIYNEAFLWYWWYKEKIDDLTVGTGGVTAASTKDPAPFANFRKNELTRKDIISYGVKMLTTPGFPTSVPLLSENPGWNQARNRQIAHVPPPRIGRMGIRIQRGEALVCVANIENLTQHPNTDNGAGGHMQTILGKNTLRWLCTNG